MIPNERQSRGLFLGVWESRRADAGSSEHARGCSPLPGTNSPGLDDPSLIRIGLAKLTRIVLPKSSDSFCRGKKHNKVHQKVKHHRTPQIPAEVRGKQSLLSLRGPRHTAPRSVLAGRRQSPASPRARGNWVRTMLSMAAAASCQKARENHYYNIFSLSLRVPQHFVAKEIAKGPFSQTSSTPGL